MPAWPAADRSNALPTQSAEAQRTGRAASEAAAAPGSRASWQPVDGIESLVTRIGMIAGATAAAVVFVAAVGGAVMWLRFRIAGIPADQAVALVPRADLVVVGLRLMILPVAIAGVLSTAYVRWQQARPAAPDPAEGGRALGLSPAAAANEEPEGGERAEQPRGPGTRAASRRVGPLSLGPAWARPRVLTCLQVLLAGALVVCVPCTLGALAWPIAAVALLRYHRHLCGARVLAGGGGAPVLRLAIAAMIAAAVVSIARQLSPPVQLPSIQVVAGKTTVDGSLVTANAAVVAVAPTGSRSIQVFPRSQVQEIRVGPPLDRRSPPRSLLSHMLAGAAWAATPLKVWCGGEQYSWWRLGDACRTQPEVKGVARTTGTAVSVVLDCPERADEGCAGFVTIRSSDTFTSRGVRQRVILGQAPFAAHRDARLAVRVRMPPATRRIVAGPRPIPVQVLLSYDVAGKASVPHAAVDASVEVRAVERQVPRGARRTPRPGTPGPAGPGAPAPPAAPRREPATPRPAPDARQESPPDPEGVPPAGDRAIGLPSGD